MGEIGCDKSRQVWGEKTFAGTLPLFLPRLWMACRVIGTLGEQSGVYRTCIRYLSRVVCPLRGRIWGRDRQWYGNDMISWYKVKWSKVRCRKWDVSKVSQVRWSKAKRSAGGYRGGRKRRGRKGGSLSWSFVDLSLAHRGSTTRSAVPFSPFYPTSISPCAPTSIRPPMRYLNVGAWI